MPPPHDIIAALVIAGIALVLGAIGARVFRGAGLPGGMRAAGLMGGLIVGLLAGQGVVGVYAPGVYDAWVQGGVAEREALDAYDDETRAGVIAITQLGTSQVASDEYARERQGGRVALSDALAAASSARTNAIDTAQRTLLALLVVCLAPYWIPREGRQRATGGLGVLLGVVLAVALLGTLVKATSPAFPPWVAPVVAGLCAVLAPSPSARSTRDLAMKAIIGFFLCFALIRLLGIAGRPGARASVLGADELGLAMLLILIGSLVYQSQPRTRVRRWRKTLATVAYAALLPGACAMSAMHLDIHAIWGDWLFWVLAISAALASSDLRWYALAKLYELTGRERPLESAERCANAGAGIAQLLLSVLAHHAGLIDERLLLALIIGAVIGEMTVDLRRKIAHALERGDSVASVFEFEDRHNDIER